MSKLASSAIFGLGLSLFCACSGERAPHSESEAAIEQDGNHSDHQSKPNDAIDLNLSPASLNENLIACRDQLNGKPTSCVVRTGPLTSRFDRPMTFDVIYVNTCYVGNEIRAGLQIDGTGIRLNESPEPVHVKLVGFGPLAMAEFDAAWNRQIFVRKNCEIKVSSIVIQDAGPIDRAILEGRSSP